MDTQPPRNVVIVDRGTAGFELLRGSGIGRIERETSELFCEFSGLQVRAGQRVHAAGHRPFAALRPSGESVAVVADVERVVGKCVAAMPGHAECIERHGRVAEVQS